MNQINHNNIIQFLDENYPVLLLDLQENDSLASWIAEKCSTITEPADEAEFFLVLGRELGTSQHNYIKTILEEDFPADYQRLVSIGVLKYELINMANACAEILEMIPLTEENETSIPLRLAITGVVSDYLYQTSVA